LPSIKIIEIYFVWATFSSLLFSHSHLFNHGRIRKQCSGVAFHYPL
jgi:hypothetical protein